MSTNLRKIGLSVKRLQMRHHREANSALAKLKISIVQWDALRHLAENPRASLHDLAVLTFQSDQAFGTLATRMIERGLISRVTSDGRAIHHVITEKGHALRRKADKILERVLEKSFAPLSASELATLDELLIRVLQPQPTPGHLPRGPSKTRPKAPLPAKK
jgi:DNA-binding MarR family transcriptional regulator